MSVLALSKDQLRHQYLKLRGSLSRDFVEKSSQLVAQRVLRLEKMTDIKVASAYLPVNNEVETKTIIYELVKRRIKILLPKYFQDKEGYFWAKFDGWQNLERGPFGILQPNSKLDNKPGLENFYKPGLNESQSENTPGVNLDIAIIPGLIFDKNGWRLGYGKGVFDRLLAGSKALKIGLAYDFQIMDELPRDKHDLVMDLVITEEEVILC